jgi:dipeptidyl aminopeptidase/acylaminoacyl peptidase
VKIAAFGTWSSPVAADRIAVDSLRLSEPRIDGERVFWVEGRPAEGGRCVLVRHDADGTCGDVLPPSYSVRSRVNEYGGGPYAVRGDLLCFVNDPDQCLYLVRPDGVKRLTAPGGRRFADLVLDVGRQRVLCVCEDHEAPGEPLTTLVAVDLESGGMRTLARGADFYATPMPSADGSRIAWVEWRHRNMPWDRTELWVANVDTRGGLHDPRRVAGGGESIQQPAWHEDGTLYFVSDRDDWWNLQRWDGARTSSVTHERAELAGAPWVSGTTSYALLPDGSILCAVTRDGRRELERARLADGAFTSLHLPFTDVEGVRVAHGRAVFIGATPLRQRAIVSLDMETRRWRELRAASTIALDPRDVSVPQPLAFATGADETAYALYYAPTSAHHTAPPPDERPPLIVRCHGGPTSSAVAALDLRTQFWTSRGFALLDVNYRGSTGFGRGFRERLYGGWGLVDVEDCARAAEHVAAEGLADGARAVISGSSSGGYTVLCALVRGDDFRAGARHYGIGDLELLVRDTHKFESRYVQRLVGEDPRVWRERSPVHHADRIRSPVLFLQGLDDRVVPPEQSRRMAAALRARGIPGALIEFAGEGHGFRRAANVQRAFEAELDFHARVLGFSPADTLTPVDIDPPLSRA